MATDDERPKLVKRYTRLAIVAGFLLALLWPLNSFFFWIFFGATAYFAFLAFYYRPRVEKKEEFFSSPKFSTQQPRQSGPTNVAPKNVRLIIAVLIISVFAMFFLLIIIGIATSEEGAVEDTAPIDREVLQTEPNNLDALTNLGNSFYNKGQYDSALSYYERVLTIDPTNSGGLYNKGLVFYQIKDYQKSMEALRKCISLYPYIYDQQNRKTEAIQFYKETLQQDSSLVEVYNRLAELEPGRAEWYKKKSEEWK